MNRASLLVILAVIAASLVAVRWSPWVHPVLAPTALTRSTLATTGESTVPVLSTSGTTTWIEEKVGRLQMLVPYSPQWRVDGIGVSPIDEEVDAFGWTVRFGRPIDTGMTLTREFVLSRELSVPKELLFARYSPGCSDERPATSTTIAGMDSIVHYVGGASGCSLGIAFTIGGFTYDLLQVSPRGADAPTPGDTAMKIVSSVKERMR